MKEDRVEAVYFCLDRLWNKGIIINLGKLVGGLVQVLFRDTPTNNIDLHEDCHSNVSASAKFSIGERTMRHYKEVHDNDAISISILNNQTVRFFWKKDGELH